MSKPDTLRVGSDFSSLMDISKMISEFRVPGFNMEALIDAHRKNIEAITTINRAAFESVQSLARQQLEFVQQSCEETSGMFNAVMTSSAPHEKIMRHAEASKIVMEKYMANARDMAETITKCNTQTMETISGRFSEALPELREIIKIKAAKTA